MQDVFEVGEVSIRKDNKAQLKERIVREVGYGLSLEGASSAALMKSMQAKNEPVARKGKAHNEGENTSLAGPSESIPISSRDRKLAKCPDSLHPDFLGPGPWIETGRCLGRPGYAFR